MPKVADVYLPVPLDQPFSYLVEDATPLYGRVEVTLRGQRMIGVVGALKEPEEVKASYEIKPVEKVIDQTPIMTEATWQMANWISEYYVSPLGEVLGTLLPKAKRPTPLFHASVSPKSLYKLNTEQQKAFDPGFSCCRGRNQIPWPV